MFLTTHAAALRLGLTCDAVRWHERHGHLTTIKVERSPGSYQRLYIAEDVERFRQQRAVKVLARQEQAALVDVGLIEEEAHG